MARRKLIWRLVAACCVLAAAVVLWPRLPRVASTALSGAEQYTLLSIDPRRPEQLAGDEFHGFRVLGQTSVSDPAVRGRLNAALRSGVKVSLQSRKRCFNPRHGIRVTSGGVTTDLLICFECELGVVFRDRERVAEWETTGRSPQAVFDEVLGEAGVPLAGSAE